MSCGNHYKSAHWSHASHGHVPNDAVQGGYDLSDTIYVARAHHSGEIIPGKLVPGHGSCYICHSGEEHKKSEYEVLCNPHGLQLDWIDTSGGNIPNGALQGGISEDGEPLYIGRAQHEGTITVGKVHPSHGCLYIPFAGSEQNYSDYEILVCKCLPL